MNYVKPIESAEIAEAPDLAGGVTGFRRADTTDGEIMASNLGNLLRRVSGVSMREIDKLINELQALREKLRADSDRIQRDIEDYAAVSQQAMQLTKIICESVRNLPDAARMAD